MSVQSIVNNLTPILFVIFKDKFGISYSLIATLLLINFVIQIFTDILSIKILSVLDYRKSGILAELSVILGLVLLGTLPNFIPPYSALLISTLFTAFGGGLLEVLLSPIVDAISEDHDSAKMSLLHSFYSWGQVFVVLLTTIGVKYLSYDAWWVLPLLWTVIPIISAILFANVYIPEIAKEERETKANIKLFTRVFVEFCFLMICSGAAEIAMAEWASVFAQKGLGVDKFIGDILGPCMFAVFMGSGRILYGIFGAKINLRKALICASVLCTACYLISAISNNALVALIFCAITGFSVSLMWPGVYSYASKSLESGLTKMFGLLALFGDVGCSLGSWLAGVVSDFSVTIPSVMGYADKIGITGEQMGLKIGIGISSIFSIAMLIVLLFNNHKQQG